MHSTLMLVTMSGGGGFWLGGAEGRKDLAYF